MSKSLKQNLVVYGMVMPAFLVVMLTVAYPIVSAVIQSFQDSATGAFTLDNYMYFFTDEAQKSNLAYTLYIVIVTVVVAIVVAYLLALYLRFVKSRIAKAIGMLYLLPRFVPAMCAVYAMITIIRDTGLINRIGQLFGVNINLGMMYHASGIITMNLWFNIPFAAMMIAAGLGGIPDSIIEAASDVGAGKIKIFTSMILPLSIKDVIVAATFVFMSNVSSFTTPYLMGGNSPRMLGIALYDQFNRYLEYNRSAALSVIMFLICSVSAGVYIYTNLKENDWEK
ncbi:MAG TPA: ABC transporter permease subunit [Candidatus Fimousia stercorigallinarum]|nr:ABC transporter permease subunit [Candidatus Fimousia stercorigallinarum]